MMSKILVLLFLTLGIINAIKVPIYDSDDDELIRITAGSRPRPNLNYRRSIPKNKKLNNRNPENGQTINYGKQISNDAIRIVEPPKYFQEQKNFFRGSNNGFDAPRAGKLKAKRNRPPGQQNPYRQQDASGPGSNSFRQYVESSPVPAPFRQSVESVTGPLAFRQPQSSQLQQQYLQQKQQQYLRKKHKQQPQQSQQYHKHQQSELPYRGSAYANNNIVVTPPPSQRYHHAVSIQHPKPTPTYSGIQTPNPQSLRAQIHSFKEKQKYYFEDDEDEHPARKRNPTVQHYVGPHDPSEFGQDIFDEQNDNYERLKGNYFPDKGYKGYSVEEEPPQSTPPVKPKKLKSAEKAHPTFVPYKMLASVRHTNRIQHKPYDPDDPRAKSRLKTRKTQTVYSEQGFEDVEYDHGDAEKHASQQAKLHRRRRSVEDETNDEFMSQVEEVKELPLSLTLMQSDGTKLSGQDLLQHIARLIKESSKYLPDDPEDENPDLHAVVLNSDELEEIFAKTVNQKKKENSNVDEVPSSQISDISAVNYAEKLENYDESPYDKNEDIDCEGEEPEFEQNNQKKKLGNLGDKLECMKLKLFGEDPLSNPLFKENIIVMPSGFEATAFKSFNGYPSQLVYHDVMRNIQSTLENEKKNNFLTLTRSINGKQSPASNEHENLDDYSNFDEDDERDGRQLKKSNKKRLLPLVNSKDIFRSPGRLRIFDINPYVPEAYMIRPDGKIYGLKFRPKQEATVSPTKRRNNENFKSDDKPKNSKRSHKEKTQSKRNKNSKNRQRIQNRDSNSRPKVIAVEPVKFKHEDGVRQLSIH